jgi:hypothetical protein
MNLRLFISNNFLKFKTMKRSNIKALLSALSILILFFITSTIVYGSGNVLIYPIEGSKKAIVNISVPQRADVILSIQSIDGTGLYYETISDRPIYSRVYDFTDLDNGLYRLVATTGPLVVRDEFEVKDSKIEVRGGEVEYMPVFMLNGRLLLVNFLNKGAHEVEVTLEDNTDIIFKEKNSNNITFEKVYDISSLPKGYYIVRLAAGDKSYNYYFEVN